jgi:SAM-dependent methyltransferase
MNSDAAKLKEDGYVAEGWVPQLWMWDKIQEAENKGIISPGQKVLELGSGNGSVLMLWAYKGYDVTGIEIQHTLAEYSKKALFRHKKLLANPKVRVIEGSYYPQEHIDYREANPTSDAILLEEKILHERGFRRSEYPYLCIDCWEDVYEKHNFSIRDFDIIYAYLYHPQVPSVAEIFRRYAKHDAKLFLVTDDNPMPRETASLLRVEQHPESHRFFTKA